MELMELFHRLSRNGWKWIGKESDIADYSRYQMTLLSNAYHVTCTINIAEDEAQLTNNGQYGIAWIDVEYENEAPYSVDELIDMLAGIAYAEDNLLLIGIPFTDDYGFSGRNAEIKKQKRRKNALIRRDLGLDEMEREAGWRK